MSSADTSGAVRVCRRCVQSDEREARSEADRKALLDQLAAAHKRRRELEALLADAVAVLPPLDVCEWALIALTMLGGFTLAAAVLWALGRLIGAIGGAL